MNKKYVYVKLLSNSTITNETTNNIASKVNILNRKLKLSFKEGLKKALDDNQRFKISFLTHVNKTIISFYAIVPKYFFSEFETVCENTWKGINLEIVDELPFEFEDKYTMTKLSTNESDALSLRTDKRDNFLLSNILSTSNILREDEDMVMMYNFVPCSRVTIRNHKENMKTDLEKYKKSYSISKNKSTLSKIGNIAKISMKYASDVVTDTAKEFGIDMNLSKPSDKSMFDNLISEESKGKAKLELIQTQMIVLSKTKDNDKDRQKDINTYVADNFDCIKKDNKIVYKTKYIKDKKGTNLKKFDFLKYKYEAPVSVFSINECQHFISLPGSSLMKEYKNIENIPYKQVDIPDCVSNGYLTAGTGNNRGQRKEIMHTNEDIEIATKGIYMLGPMGTGKSTYMKRYICDALMHEDLVVIFDYIGYNEFATDLEKMLPKNFINVIDLSICKGKGAQSIAYNELDVKHIKREDFKTQEDYEEEVCECIGDYAQQVIFLMQSINGVGVGSEFTNRMEKVIRGAAVLTFYKENQTLMDMYKVLTDHIYRHKVLDEMPSFIRKDFNTDITEFLTVVDFSKIDLDPITKKPKLDEFGNPKQIVLGTQESSITFLLDRFNPLRSNRKIRQLAEKDPSDNLDFAELFYKSKKKVIIIKLPDDAFQEKQKDILCNFYANKILLAMKLRNSKYKRDNPKDPKAKNMTLAHVMFDEVHLLSGTLRLIQRWLTQFRKFRVKPFFSGHHMGQLPIDVANDIKAAGYNYMITGALDEKSFGTVSEFFKEFNSEQCNNLISDPVKHVYQYMLSLCYSSGRKNFIVNAPGDVTVSGHPILKEK